MQDISSFSRKLESWNLKITEKQQEQFIKYYELLIERNKVMNLTAITEWEEVVQKHFIDSLSFVKAGVIKEQKELKTKIEQLSKEINNTEKKTTDLTQFISNVKKYTEITELTPEILNELIEKILVHQTEKINGKKVQEIDIYYRGVGIISFPVSLEDMTMVIEKMINKKISA